MPRLITQRAITVTRGRINGAYNCTCMLDGQLVQTTYYGFTKRRAVRDFADSINRRIHSHFRKDPCSPK